MYESYVSTAFRCSSFCIILRAQPKVFCVDTVHFNNGSEPLGQHVPFGSGVLEYHDLRHELVLVIIRD